MIRPTLLLALLAACGDDGTTATADAPFVPAMVTMQGVAKAYTATGTQPIEGVVITAHRTGDDDTVVLMTTTGADGSYSLTHDTGGLPIDGYLRATFPGYMTTYLIPPAPVIADFSGGTVAMLTPDIFDLMVNTFCGANQPATGKAAIAVITLDAAQEPVAGATIASAPAAGKYCYNEGGYPSRNASATDVDGAAYFLNVEPGDVRVSAMAPGITYPSHKVLARADVFTTTLFMP